MEDLLITHPGCGFGRGMLMVLAGSRKVSMFDRFHSYFLAVNGNISRLLVG